MVSLTNFHRADVVELLISRTSHPGAPTVLYFFCDYAEDKSLETAQILRSFLKQLFLQSALSNAIIEEVRHPHGNTVSFPIEIDRYEDSAKFSCVQDRST